MDVHLIKAFLFSFIQSITEMCLMSCTLYILHINTKPLPMMCLLGSSDLIPNDG